MSTFVSMTRRTIGASILQNIGKYFLGHSPLCGFGRDAIHCTFEFGNIGFADALVLIRRHNHNEITILFANQNGLPQRGFGDAAETLLRIRRSDDLHLSIIDIMDNIDKYHLLDQGP